MIDSKRGGSDRGPLGGEGTTPDGRQRSRSGLPGCIRDTPCAGIDPDQVRRGCDSQPGREALLLCGSGASARTPSDWPKPSKFSGIAVRSGPAATSPVVSVLLQDPQTTRALLPRPAMPARPLRRLSRAPVERGFQRPPTRTVLPQHRRSPLQSLQQSLRINLRLLSQGGEDAAAAQTLAINGRKHRAKQGPGPARRRNCQGMAASARHVRVLIPPLRGR